MRFTTFALAVASFAVPALALDCTVPTSTSTAVTTNGTCACADGWTGPSCNICTSDKACTLLKDAARGMCKANAYSAVKQGNGYCMVRARNRCPHMKSLIVNVGVWPLTPPRGAAGS
jgi:hypothetical protein